MGREVNFLVFSSLFFIYAFLAANLLCCAFSRHLYTQNAVLLVFSLVFYAWGEPVYLLLLIGVALVDFYCALRGDCCLDDQQYCHQNEDDNHHKHH